MSISDKNTRITVTISKELKEKAEQKAEAESRPLSNYIIHLIEQDLLKSKHE